MWQKIISSKKYLFVAIIILISILSYSVYYYYDNRIIPASELNTSDYTYSANIDTKKFHKMKCRYVKNTDISSRYYENDREKLIRKGYVPCKVCKP